MHSLPGYLSTRSHPTSLFHSRLCSCSVPWLWFLLLCDITEGLIWLTPQCLHTGQFNGEWIFEAPFSHYSVSPLGSGVACTPHLVSAKYSVTLGAWLAGWMNQWTPSRQLRKGLETRLDVNLNFLAEGRRAQPVDFKLHVTGKRDLGHENSGLKKDLCWVIK